MTEISEHLIGLYYPSIQFKNDSWVKVATLYWDKIGRIVPADYPHSDSDVVKQLIEEADFIRDLEPSVEDLETTAELFLTLLQKHGRQLKVRYNLKSKNETIFLNYPQRFSNIIDRVYRDEKQQKNPKLTFIASTGKMAPKLKQAFIQKGLAQYVDLSDDLNHFEFVEMHPQLAFPYMEVLAEQMAFTRKIHPITDDISNHHTISQYTVERLANNLLRDVNTPYNAEASSEENLKIGIANITIRSLLPKNLDNIPVGKIIQFRNRYRDELTSFQIHLEKFVSNLKNVQEVKDPKTLDMFLTIEYEKNLKPQLANLQKCLNSLSIDTVMGVLNIRVAQPNLAASLEAYAPAMPASPILTGIGAAGAVIYSMFPVLRKQRGIAKNLIDSSPVAYLLYMQEELEPSTINQRLSQFARRSILGV